MRRALNLLLSFLAAGALVLATGVHPAAGSAGAPGPTASIAKKCKKKKKKCGKNTRKPWAGSGYRPGQVCSLAPKMQKKYKRYGLVCLDFGFGTWTLEPL